MKSINNSINSISNKTMLKQSFLMLALTLVMVACGGGSDKKAQLEKLKKEKASLDTKITLLEEEIAKTDTTKKEQMIEVVANPLKAAIFKSYIEIQGRVDADENVSLTSEMPGTITKINVKVGDHVSKGQVLAETDARAIVQQLSELETNLDLAKQMFSKQENLWNQKIGTEMQYLQSKATKEGLEKRMSTVQEQLRMSKIITPIDGTVDLVNLKIGQAVSPGFGVINVVNFSNLKVKADVAESYTSRVKNGNEVLVLFPDMADSLYSKVHYASRSINNLTRTFAIEVLLDTKNEYHPNMVAKLKINDYQSAKPEILVPVKFIQKSSDGSYVFTSENGVVVKKVVTVNREYSGVAEIASGLKEGELLITSGYDLVNEGDKVDVKK